MFTTSIKHLALRLLPDPLLQPLRKAHYARKLGRGGREPEMSVIPHLLPRGGCALDLGANFGLYTQFLAETVGPAGQVHAVEPVPGTCDVLRTNVRRLGLSAVSVYNLAVSDGIDEVTMAVPQYDRGGDNLYEARVIHDETAAGERTVRVPAARLDDLFGRLGRIDFVKCDVEGHELSVVRGAGEILRVHRPAWLMEVSGDPDDPDSAAAEVVRLMGRAGYRVFHLDGDEARPREVGDRAVNYFFLRSEHVRRLRTVDQAQRAHSAGV
jgi:FkbM family methyltransferase